MLYTFLLILHVIVSLFLIFIILIQSGKGEGLSDVFGGGSSQTTIFGTRTGNFLTKATTGSAIIFMITCLSLGFISRHETGSVVQNDLVKKQAAEKVKAMVKGEETVKEEPAAAQASQAALETETPIQEEVSQQEPAAQPAAEDTQGIKE